MTNLGSITDKKGLQRVIRWPGLPRLRRWASRMADNVGALQVARGADLVPELMTTLYINGKFLAQPLTGVQRFARELLSAADCQRAVADQPDHWEVLCPPGASARAPAWSTIRVREVGPGGLPLHLWEQVLLPWAARGGQLLSLTGSAPYWPAGQLCTLHDAAVFDWPQAYQPLFLAWYRRLFRRQAAQALALFTVSSFSRGQLARHLGVDPARLHLVPDAADHLDPALADDSVLDRLGLRGQRYLMAVGSANPAKNQGRLLQAFEQTLAEVPQARLVMVGGSNKAVFAQRMQMPDAGQVLCAGILSDGELTSLYRYAQGLIFPSLYEGFGLPPLEAMTLGCPVAVARAAAMPEVCGDAVLYFDPLSTHDIARAMRALLGDEGLRLSLSQAGREQARKWRWADAARALLAHLDALQKQGPGAP